MLSGCSGCSVLQKMAGREVSFEEQTTAIREFIAGVLEEEEDWGEAAKVRNPQILACTGCVGALPCCALGCCILYCRIDIVL